MKKVAKVVGLTLAVIGWGALMAWVAIGESNAPACEPGEASIFGAHCAP